MRAVDLATRATCTCRHHQLLMRVSAHCGQRCGNIAIGMSPMRAGHGSGASTRDAQPHGFGQTAQLVKHLG